MAHAEKCPVCKGSGKVPAGFYEPYDIDDWGNHITTVVSAELEICRSCGGKGWVEVSDEQLQQSGYWPRYDLDTAGNAT